MDVLHNFHEQVVFERSLSEHLDIAEMIFQLHPASVNGFVHCLQDPQISFFNKTFIKNGSHGTIHTFKNYFATMFLVFSNKRYPNRPLMFLSLPSFPRNLMLWK